MKRNYKNEQRDSILMGNKRGVLPLTAVLFYLGVAILGFGAGVGIDLAFGDQESPLTEEQIATLQNSFVPQIQEQTVLNGTAYQNRLLVPKPSEELVVSIGLLVVRYDTLANAVAGVNFTTAMSSVNRKYFVNLNGQSIVVDPINSSYCVVETDNSVNVSYTCAFTYSTTNVSAPGDVFNEVSMLSSSTNHVRTFDVVTIIPRDIPDVLTTADGVAQFYFEISRTVWTLMVDIFVKLYLLFKIVFFVALSGFAVFVLYFIWRFIAKPPKRRGDMDGSDTTE